MSDTGYDGVDYALADRNYEWHLACVNLGDRCASTDNHEYSRQMWLDGMSYLDTCYDELRVQHWNNMDENHKPCTRWSEVAGD